MSGLGELSPKYDGIIYPCCVMVIINFWYGCLQIRHSIHASSLLETKDCAGDQRTGHHGSGDELRIARLGRS
jgi:hypothetical protein